MCQTLSARQRHHGRLAGGDRQRDLTNLGAAVTVPDGLAARDHGVVASRQTGDRERGRVRAAGAILDA